MQRHPKIIVLAPVKGNSLSVSEVRLHNCNDNLSGSSAVHDIHNSIKPLQTSVDRISGCWVGENLESSELVWGTVDQFFRFPPRSAPRNPPLPRSRPRHSGHRVPHSAAHSGPLSTVHCTGMPLPSCSCALPHAATEVQVQLNLGPQKDTTHLKRSNFE